LLSKAFVAIKYDSSPIFPFAKRTANFVFSSSKFFISCSILKEILPFGLVDRAVSRKEQLISHFHGKHIDSNNSLFGGSCKIPFQSLFPQVAQLLLYMSDHLQGIHNQQVLLELLRASRLSLTF
jgi:hypothetical protein